MRYWTIVMREIEYYFRSAFLRINRWQAWNLFRNRHTIKSSFSSWSVLDKNRMKPIQINHILVQETHVFFFSPSSSSFYSSLLCFFLFFNCSTATMERNKHWIKEHVTSNASGISTTQNNIHSIFLLPFSIQNDSKHPVRWMIGILKNHKLSFLYCRVCERGNFSNKDDNWIKRIQYSSDANIDNGSEWISLYRVQLKGH